MNRLCLFRQRARSLGRFERRAPALEAGLDLGIGYQQPVFGGMVRAMSSTRC
jgi:hypothetical protein